jgi:hypothetical protein
MSVSNAFPLHAAPLPEVRNHAGYPSQYFQSMDAADEIFHVLVSRLTYDLRRLDAAGRPMLNACQHPLADADRFYGEPNVSSLIEESDFAPYKPQCDILFAHATAHAPNGRAEKRWSVGVRVGDCHKMLTVTGPRHMKAALMGWTVTESQAVREVPLRYEYAFGGACRWPSTLPKDAEPELLLRYAANPVGLGYAPDKWLRKSRVSSLPAPQIEHPKHPFDAWAASAQNYPALGLGALGRWWAPRVKQAGTYDAQWKKERWPRLPRDFDFTYWNCAPPDQRIVYPVGGEPIVLAGLLPDAETLRASLPDNPPFGLVRLGYGPLMTWRMLLDTLLFDLRAMTLSCVYRMAVPARANVRVLEIRQKAR